MQPESLFRLPKESQVRNKKCFAGVAPPRLALSFKQCNPNVFAQGA
jgi:hypothetical protein